MWLIKTTKELSVDKNDLNILIFIHGS